MTGPPKARGQGPPAAAAHPPPPACLPLLPAPRPPPRSLSHPQSGLRIGGEKYMMVAGEPGEVLRGKKGPGATRGAPAGLNPEMDSPAPPTHPPACTPFSSPAPDASPCVPLAQAGARSRRRPPPWWWASTERECPTVSRSVGWAAGCAACCELRSCAAGRQRGGGGTMCASIPLSETAYLHEAMH